MASSAASATWHRQSLSSSSSLIVFSGSERFFDEATMSSRSAAARTTAAEAARAKSVGRRSCGSPKSPPGPAASRPVPPRRGARTPRSRPIECRMLCEARCAAAVVRQPAQGRGAARTAAAPRTAVALPRAHCSEHPTAAAPKRFILDYSPDSACTAQTVRRCARPPG